MGEVAKRVKALQYEKESWEVEMIPEPAPVSDEGDDRDRGSNISGCISWANIP